VVVASGSGTRRQPRGERRIDQILAAAGVVFARVGYVRATTNAIAAEAGISPGSLYQFFPNKEAIAEALEARYALQMRNARFPEAEVLAALPLDEAIDRLIDPVVEYTLVTPGFHALFAGRPQPDHVAASAHDLHHGLVARVDAIVAAASPEMPATERKRISAVAVQLCRGVMPLIATADDASRPALVAEMKAALVGYLTERTSSPPVTPRT
jgi:AcrR family transcriptional regulator